MSLPVSLDHITIEPNTLEPKAELGDRSPRQGVSPPDDLKIPLNEPKLDGSDGAMWNLKCWISAQHLKRDAHAGFIKWPPPPTSWEPTQLLSIAEKESLKENEPFKGNRIDLREKLCQAHWESLKFRAENRVYVDLTSDAPVPKPTKPSENVLQLKLTRKDARDVTDYDCDLMAWGPHWRRGEEPDKSLVEQQDISIRMYGDISIPVNCPGAGSFPIRQPRTFKGTSLNMSWPKAATSELHQRIFNRLSRVFDELSREHRELFNVPTQRMFVALLSECVLPFHVKDDDATKPQPGRHRKLLSHPIVTIYHGNCRHFIAVYLICAVLKESFEAPGLINVRIRVRDLEWIFDENHSMVPPCDLVMRHPLMGMFYERQGEGRQF